MKRLLMTPALLFLGAVGGTASGQIVQEWTEQPGSLGLGYPVPIPVDTPLPVDGFRSYQGLLSRHQDFLMSHSFVSGSVVGETEYGRDIWAYQYGDPDNLTVTGLPEGAVMTQGGIHAREWQSPEVLTGIMEQLVANRDDQWLYQFLIENLNMVLLPVLNIDGFLQTQRYPTLSYLDTSSPRDGRMRRKNMLGVDEIFDTYDDHALGVDLNRNNPPFWATNSGGSSSDPASIVHHGSGPHSEPETQAMVEASRLGPQDRLRMFTDVHSFSQVHFSINTDNARRNAIQRNLLLDFSDFHGELEGGKIYENLPSNARQGVAIGSTDEYFAVNFGVPSWTLEIEPTGSASSQPLPGCGADYGGFASNCHDGFILPESEIRRVRENLAQTFPITYYSQSGPASVVSLRWIDNLNGAVVFDAEWDVVSSTQRQLHVNQIQPLQIDGSYTLWVAFDKPMRWRNESGQVINLPGQRFDTVSVVSDLAVGSTILGPLDGTGQWLNQSGNTSLEYYRYRDDAYAAEFTLSSEALGPEVNGTAEAAVNLAAWDMVGRLIDSNPGTAADWDSAGNWIRYENTEGAEGDSGGTDSTITFSITDQPQDAPFLISPGISAVWYDPSHNGEGFVVEILDENRAVVYWFTYDKSGNQRWFIGTGRVRGNEVVLPQLLESSGGIFGENFDPSQVVFSDAGSASFLWSDCGSGQMRHNVDVLNQRQATLRLTDATGPGCEFDTNGFAPLPFTGSWYDLDHNGEGFVISAAGPGRVVVYWFTYDSEGNQAWIVGEGSFSGGSITITDALIASGGIFGDAFDPDLVTLKSWGSMEFELGCDTGSMIYSSALPGFGSGSQSLTRLTLLAGLGCQPGAN